MILVFHTLDDGTPVMGLPLDDDGLPREYVEEADAVVEAGSVLHLTVGETVVHQVAVGAVERIEDDDGQVLWGPPPDQEPVAPEA